ncbi:MAG TPA: preprotein translocase subunit YajC [Galbitalea sp.]
MNIFNIVLIVVAVGLVLVMMRNGRRNKARQAELRSQMVPGSEIMTNFGLFGKLLSVDELSNVAEVETSPGTIVRVHRQTLSKVVTPEDADPNAPRSVEEAMERANREAEEKEAESQKQIDAQGEPEFGERVEPVEQAATKPARRASKKADD